MAASEVERAARMLVLVFSRAEDSVQSQISAAQLRALVVVGRRGQLNLSQLASELGTIPSWASRLCDRLVAAGYVERRASDERRREIVLSLGRDGRRLLDELEARRREALADVLSCMAPDDRAALQRGLDAFAAMASAAPAAPASAAPAAPAAPAAQGDGHREDRRP